MLYLTIKKEKFVNTENRVRERQFERKTQTPVDLEEFLQFDKNGETGL